MLASPFMRLRSLSACFAALATLLQAACGTVNQGPTMAKTPPSRAADEVAVWMMGNYSSSAQAKSDPENFKSVVLHIAPIWVERIDGRWLYMEQAMADTPDKPYRQRVYRIMDEAGGVENMVFELPGEPLRFAGAWKDTDRMNQLMPQLLTPLEGCSVHLKRTGNAEWTGGTGDQLCESALRGATHAHSQWWLKAGELRTWDQGFDASGKQVWGTANGPYIFIKETSK